MPQDGFNRRVLHWERYRYKIKKPGGENQLHLSGLVARRGIEPLIPP